MKTMQRIRISELLQPFLEPAAGLTKSVCHSEPAQSSGVEPAVQAPSQDLISRISTYIDMLLRWNARINLTAIRNPEEIVTRHFGESLFAAHHLFPANLANTRVSLADLGSGAGFPGVPIKLWAPHILLTLIESNHKKVTFLREITRELTLTDVNIQTARAELLTDVFFDVVTMRAVERFESILPTAARLVAPGGHLALLIGSTQQSAARYALPDLSWLDPIPIPLSQSRVLLIAQRS
jgi:16S rRNA (guanine527-N7)-methyltransferase